jgi:hypothetical protein
VKQKFENHQISSTLGFGCVAMSKEGGLINKKS